MGGRDWEEGRPGLDTWDRRIGSFSRAHRITCVYLLCALHRRDVFLPTPRRRDTFLPPPSGASSAVSQRQRVVYEVARRAGLMCLGAGRN
jgi:hypothetical protein